MQKPRKLYIPRAPRNHGLFGTKFVKQHMFLSDKWPVNSVSAQYQCMVDFLKKNTEFNRHAIAAERQKQTKSLQKLKSQCKEVRMHLQKALHGDKQRIKNILQDHKEMKRLYMMMPLHMVVENINQRTFVKRKERDRLYCKRKFLTKKYEEKLLEMSELQNQIRFQDEYVLPEEVQAKRCKRQITNTRTRLQAVKTIKNTYEKIIHVLRHDAIYYDVVLQSLHQDLEEQMIFITRVIELGIPAIDKTKKLHDEYLKTEEKTRKNLQQKLYLIAAFKDKLKSEAEDVKEHLRSVDDYVRDPDWYNRETQSMLELKAQYEEVAKVMRQVKKATLCAQAKYVYPTMKKQVADNERLEKELGIEEKERDTLLEKGEQAEAMKNLLKYNYTNDDIERNNIVQELRSNLILQTKMQNEIDEYIKERGEIFTLLRFSMYQIVDTLRSIGKPVHGIFRIYPDPNLKLPLLRFENREQRAFPPDPYEENLEKLVDIATRKVTQLMAACTEEKSPEELEYWKGKYHALYLRDLQLDKEQKEEEDQHKPLLVLLSDRADPSVPTRQQIKTQSAKIVNEFSKHED